MGPIELPEQYHLEASWTIWNERSLERWINGWGGGRKRGYSLTVILEPSWFFLFPDSICKILPHFRDNACKQLGGSQNSHPIPSPFRCNMGSLLYHYYSADTELFPILPFVTPLFFGFLNQQTQRNAESYFRLVMLLLHKFSQLFLQLPQTAFPLLCRIPWVCGV